MTGMTIDLRKELQTRTLGLYFVGVENSYSGYSGGAAPGRVFGRRRAKNILGMAARAVEHAGACQAEAPGGSRRRESGNR